MHGWAYSARYAGGVRHAVSHPPSHTYPTLAPDCPPQARHTRRVDPVYPRVRTDVNPFPPLPRKPRFADATEAFVALC